MECKAEKYRALAQNLKREYHKSLQEITDDTTLTIDPFCKNTTEPTAEILADGRCRVKYKVMERSEALKLADFINRWYNI